MIEQNINKTTVPVQHFTDPSFSRHIHSSSEVSFHSLLPSNTYLTNNIENLNTQIPRNPDDEFTLDVINERKIFPISTNTETNNTSQFIDYIKIGSLNIRKGYNNKKDHLTTFFTINNFNILGLTETGFLHQHNRSNIEKIHPSQDKDDIFYIYHDSNGDNYGSGTAIMTNSTINKHIFKSKHFKGRMIAIDLAFKGKTFFRIINIYLPANTTSKQDIKLRYDVHKECDKWITEATNLKYNVLLMGDFNADPDKYKKIKKNHHVNLNSHIYHKYNIFNITKQSKLLDLAKLHQTKPLTTWSDASNNVH